MSDIVEVAEAWTPVRRSDGGVEISINYYRVEIGRFVSDCVPLMRYIELFEAGVLQWQCNNLPRPEHNPTQERAVELLEELNRARLAPPPLARPPELEKKEQTDDPPDYSENRGRTTREAKLAVINKASKYLNRRPRTVAILAGKAADLFLSEHNIVIRASTLTTFICSSLTDAERMTLGIKQKR